MTKPPTTLPRAFVLAGGLGTRLRSVISDRPKPLAPLGDRPFLEYQLELLVRRGVREAVLCVGYLHEQIVAHFGTGAAWGLELHYSVESQPLGTGGALKLAEPLAEGPLLVLNGDTYCDLDLEALVDRYTNPPPGQPRPLAALALAEVADARQYGTVQLDAGGRIGRFCEKSTTTLGPALVSAGVYLLDPAVLGLIPAGRAVSLEREIFPSLLEDRRGMAGYRARVPFIDMGTPEGYHLLRQHLEVRQPC
jgi:NDP-sugar pyrophosphorylase family protein